MKLAYAPRASTILFSLLVSRTDKRSFLLPANICPIVPITFLKAGVPFTFVDISPDTLHMDIDAAEQLVRGGVYGGVLYAHTYGEPSTPQTFFSALKRYDKSLLVIDDRCLCIPDLNPDPQTYADVLLYSTGRAKIVELGFGGHAFINDTISYQPAHIPHNHKDLEIIEKGYKTAIAKRQSYSYTDNSWLETDTNMPTWELYCQKIVDILPVSLAQRQQLNKIYASRIPVEFQLPVDFQQWRFNLKVPYKQRVLDTLFDSGLFASSHYASLAGIMTPGCCPEAETLANNVINLFNDRHYNPAMAKKTSQIISGLLKK